MHVAFTGVIMGVVDLSRWANNNVALIGLFCNALITSISMLNTCFSCSCSYWQRLSNKISYEDLLQFSSNELYLFYKCRHQGL